MTIKQIFKKYPDQWVLIRVTKTGTHQKVLEGEPIKISEDRDEVYKAIGTVPDGEHVATLFTGEILGKGEAFAF